MGDGDRDLPDDSEEFADGGEDLGVLACVGTGGARCGRFAVIKV